MTVIVGYIYEVLENLKRLPIENAFKNAPEKQFPETFESLTLLFGFFQGYEEPTILTTNQTRRPLSTGIFSAKYVTHQHGFELTTSCLPG